MKTIVFSNRAAREFDALPTLARRTVSNALDAYAIQERGDVKALQGRDGFRLIVGRWRIIFAEDGVTVLALTIGKRETTTYRR